jgi:hypothetical protein
MDSSFPLHLWDWLLSQAEHTLNMLRPAQMLKMSWHSLISTGNMTTSATPLHHLDAKSKLMLSLKFARHGHHTPQVDTTLAMPWNTTIATMSASLTQKAHTSSTRVCSFVFFKHKYLTMPALTPSDVLIKAADILSEAITGAIPVSRFTNNAITQLLNIFKQQANSANNATSAQKVLTQQAQSQRVHTEQSNTSPRPELPTHLDKLWMDLSSKTNPRANQSSHH